MPRVLVLDDCYIVTCAIELALRREGFDVVAMTDPLMAIDHIAASPVDVVVAAYKMSLVHGTPVVREIGRLLEDRCPPIVLMSTALEEDVFDEIGSAWRPAAFLHKPFSVDELLSAVRYALPIPAVSATSRPLLEDT